MCIPYLSTDGDGFQSVIQISFITATLVCSECEYTRGVDVDGDERDDDITIIVEF
jgi:hypothetical protein